MARGATSEHLARGEERTPPSRGQGRNTAWSVAVPGVYMYTISDDRTERMIMQRCTGEATRPWEMTGDPTRSKRGPTSPAPDDPTPEVAGFRTLCTSDGRNLNYIQKGRYLVASGVVLQSDDPDAP